MRTIVMTWIGLVILSGTLMSQEKNVYHGGDFGKRLDYMMYYLDDFYVDSTDNDELSIIAIKAVLAELDPYSRYQTKEEIEKQMQDDDGVRFEGVGVDIRTLKGQTILTNIYPGSPAKAAGMDFGDVVLQVEGVDCKGLNQDQVAALLRGERGTEVMVKLRKINGQQEEYLVEREKISWESFISYFMIDKEIGFMKFKRFNKKTIAEFRSKVTELKQKGMKHLILDMRGNLGGVLTASTAMIDEFISGQRLMGFSDGHNLERTNYLSGEQGLMETGKVVLIIDDESASSSELFAGALQDYDRCLMIGTPSYGKGLIQQGYKMGDGSVLRLTIGRYYTPSGRFVQRPSKGSENWIERNFELLPDNGYTVSDVVPDSLIAKTLSGRKIVNDEGSLIPDIYFDEYQQRDPYLKELLSSGELYRFAIEYTQKNRLRLLSQYEGPMALSHDKAIVADLQSNLSSYLVREKEESGLGFEIVEGPVSDYAIKQTKAWMSALLWGTKSFYQGLYVDYPHLNKAVECIKDGTFDRLGIKY